MDEKRASHKSTGMRSAMNSHKGSTQTENLNNDNFRNARNSEDSNDLLSRLDRASDGQDSYENESAYESERSSSEDYGYAHENENRRARPQGGSGGGRPPRKRRPSKQEMQRRKRKVLLTRGIALLVIIVVIVLVITLIANGAKNKSNKAENTTTVSEETTAEGETGTTEETNANGETTTAAETTTASNTGDTIVKPDNWNGKIIYLTFDDGPSSVTEDILSVLDQYNIKATFFTLGYGSKETYQKLVNNGHALGVHSYSHDYDTIYANMENFQNDVTSLRNLLEEYTGQEIFLYRFPGGSNNEVHKNAGNMKMSDFVEYINSIGMKYVDWNASSSDAAYVTADVDVLYESSAADISYWGENTDQDTIVLLMHDAETKTTGPDMLRRLIPDFLAKGYAFDCIHKDTPDIHFDLPDE